MFCITKYPSAYNIIFNLSIAVSSAADVNDIAQDWVTGNWYILDQREMIFMCNSTMRVCLTLLDGMMNEPRGVALDPITG